MSSMIDGQIAGGAFSVLFYKPIKVVLFGRIFGLIWAYKIFFHFVKSVQIQSFFWFVFSCIWTEYEDLRSKSPFSIRIPQNTDQKNSIFGYFLQSVTMN